MKEQNTRSNVPPEARRTVTSVRSRAMFRRVTLCCWDAQVERKLHSILISRLKNAKCQGNLAHLPDLVQRDADRQKWDDQNTHGVIVIIVHDPQGDAETLEHVEGVQNLRIKKKKKKEHGQEWKTQMWMKNYFPSSPLRKEVACKIWQAHRWGWDHRCVSWKDSRGEIHSLQCPETKRLCVCVCASSPEALLQATQPLLEAT